MSHSDIVILGEVWNNDSDVDNIATTNRGDGKGNILGGGETYNLSTLLSLEYVSKVSHMQPKMI